MERPSRHLNPAQSRNPFTEPHPAESSLTLADIYYVLFRHKWKIIIFGVLGIAAAAAFYKLRPPPYVSEAKLFIRYVTEGKSVGPPGDDAKTINLDQNGMTIINTEVQILTSLDIADQVADAIGPEKILAKSGGGKDRDAAAALIQRDLTVQVPQGSSVITIVFRNPDPTILQPVLSAVIDAYLKKHVEIHAAVGIVGDFLTQETDQLRARLAQTEDELKSSLDKAGVTSVEDAEKAYPAQIAQIRQQIFSAEAELAERMSLFQQFTNHSPAPKTTSVAEVAVPQEQLTQYREALERLASLQGKLRDLLSQFTDENPFVKDVRAQISDIEDRRKKLEDKYPQLARLAASAASNSSSQSAAFMDPAIQSAQIQALQAKIKVLTAQMKEIQAEAASLGQMEVAITDLRRRKDLEEANYRYYAASLEQARINEALGTGKVSNISQIQTPSPPTADSSKINKMAAGIGVSGLIIGLGWAFLTEFYFDRSVRRPIEVERNLRLPLFLSIPDLGKNGSKQLKAAKKQLALEGSANASKESITAESLRPFHETLRDRLIGYFESRNLTHKPKLVAVTGFGKNSGVTTTAAGLANCLSETGEGNVLLVDLTVGQGSAQHFYKGNTVCGLEEILSTRNDAQVTDKLYVVAEEPSTDRLSRILPQRFSKLIPKLKASDFDYIIFDMPPVSQISVTPRLAGFMDMVLMVIESETTDRDLVKRATSLLAESKAHVGVVLNKTHNYVPARLAQESLGNI